MPVLRYGDDFGNSFSGPIRTRRPFGLSSQRGASSRQNDQQFECEMPGWNIRTRPYKFEDFIDDPVYEIQVPIFDNTAEANEILVDNTKVSRAEIVIPRGGVLLAATILAEDALAASDTNYVTFALANKLASGSGTTAMLAATAANTTKSTGGTAISAITGRSLTVNGTAANLRVNKGDILLFTATTTGTLANEVNNVTVRLRFTTTPHGLAPRAVYTAGSPLFTQLSAANGVIEGLLDNTNEAQFAGYDWDDVLLAPMSRGWNFEAYARFPTDIAANQAGFIGVGTTFNSTLSSIAEYAWFKLIASMALKGEAKDGTTTTTAFDLGFTVVANTFYLFRMAAKFGMGRNSGFVEFWLDDNFMGKITIKDATSSMLLQPIFGVQKASGTGVPAIDIDYYNFSWDRF